MVKTIVPDGHEDSVYVRITTHTVKKRRSEQTSPPDTFSSVRLTLTTVCVLINPSVVVKAQRTGTKSLIYSLLLYRLLIWAICIYNTNSPKMGQLTSHRGRLQMDYLLGYSQNQSHISHSKGLLMYQTNISNLVAHTVAKKYTFCMIVSQK